MSGPQAGWLQVSIAVSLTGVEPVSAILDMLGYAQLEIVDDLPTIEAYLAENGKYWDYVDPSALLTTPDGPYVRLYMSLDTDTKALVQEIDTALKDLQANLPQDDLGRLSIVCKKVQAEDWTTSWKQYFKPIFMDKLIIRPPWEAVTPGPEQVVVDIEPGMTFGTGNHATTALCLQLLQYAIQPGCTVLDLGCGSGILAVAALQLGASHAVLVDVDPNAAPAVRDNMERNGIPPHRYRVVIGDILRDMDTQQALSGQYDVVMSNIVADVLLALMPAVPGLLASQGIYLLSGIIDDREQELREALAAHGFAVDSFLVEEPWRAFSALRKP